MSLIVANTPDGTVVREQFVHGERAYRWNVDGSWCATADHKGPWVSLPWAAVPDEIRRAAEQGGK